MANSFLHSGGHPERAGPPDVKTTSFGKSVGTDNLENETVKSGGAVRCAARCNTSARQQPRSVGLLGRRD